LREQGAFISASHPFDRIRKGHWEPPDLLEIAPLLDAIEVFNARCLRPGYNHEAQAFANQHSLSGMVGSDAHYVGEVGMATMVMPDFHDTGELRQSLQKARAETRYSAGWVHFFSRYARWTKRVRNIQ
jgi:hypothetical protein